MVFFAYSPVSVAKCYTFFLGPNDIRQICHELVHWDHSVVISNDTHIEICAEGHLDLVKE